MFREAAVISYLRSVGRRKTPKPAAFMQLRITSRLLRSSRITIHLCLFQKLRLLASGSRASCETRRRGPCQLLVCVFSGVFFPVRSDLLGRTRADGGFGVQGLGGRPEPNSHQRSTVFWLTGQLPSLCLKVLFLVSDCLDGTNPLNRKPLER